MNSFLTTYSLYRLFIIRYLCQLIHKTIYISKHFMSTRSIMKILEKVLFLNMNSNLCFPLYNIPFFLCAEMIMPRNLFHKIDLYLRKEELNHNTEILKREIISVYWIWKLMEKSYAKRTNMTKGCSTFLTVRPNDGFKFHDGPLFSVTLKSRPNMKDKIKLFEYFCFCYLSDLNT